MPVMAYDIHNLKMTVFIYAPIWGNSGFCYLFCTGVFKLMPLTDGGFCTHSFWALFSGLAVTAVYRCIFLECLCVHYFSLYAWAVQPHLISCNTSAAHSCVCIINVCPVLIEILVHPWNWWPGVFQVNDLYGLNGDTYMQCVLERKTVLKLYLWSLYM